MVVYDKKAVALSKTTTTKHPAQTCAGLLVPRANHRLQHHQRDGVWVGPAGPLKRHRKLHQWKVGVTIPDLAARKKSRRRLDQLRGVGRPHRHGTKLGLGQLDKLVVVDSTRCSQHHAVGSVVRRDVVEQVLPGDAADVVRAAQDGATEGGPLKCGCVQVVKHNLLRHALHL